MANSHKIIALVAGLTILLGACGTVEDPRNAAFAQCITDSGTVEYGAYWCPHCQNQKKLFGTTAFKNINYVECDPNGRESQTELCLEKGIEGYPTWIFADGSRMSGELSFETLAEKTGCEAPGNEGLPAEPEDEFTFNPRRNINGSVLINPSIRLLKPFRHFIA